MRSMEFRRLVDAEHRLLTARGELDRMAKINWLLSY